VAVRREGGEEEDWMRRVEEEREKYEVGRMEGGGNESENEYERERENGRERRRREKEKEGEDGRRVESRVRNEMEEMQEEAEVQTGGESVCVCYVYTKRRGSEATRASL